MNTKTFSFAAQKNRWGLTVFSTILFIILGPFMSIMAFIPRMMTALPLALIILLGYVGPVSFIMCTGICIAYAALVFGVWGAVGTAVFLIPPVICTAFTCERNMPFWKAGTIIGAATLVCEYLVLAIISMVAGQDAISAIMQMFVDFFNENSALTTALVDGFIQSGLLTAPDTLISAAQLSEPDRIAILQNLIQNMDRLLRLEVPMQIATGAVSVALLGQFMMRKSMRAKGENPDCPPVRLWSIPSGFGRIMAITVAALYLVTLVSRGTSAMFYVVSGVFEQFLALQGIAAVCYLLHENGKSRGWQIAVFIVGYFVLNMVAVVLGVVDQAFDFTHRREKIKELEEKKKRDAYDPRAGR
ncbi:MAG: DUF2232 domain-containing protein [Clostridia bacterium]|nr:DUF2232 domain-containing protein [Clostridia bacterium]